MYRGWVQSTLLIINKFSVRKNSLSKRSQTKSPLPTKDSNPMRIFGQNMFTSLICGSFHDQDLEDDRPLSRGNSPRSTKKSRAKGHSFVRRFSSDEDCGKNPYSMVGLDKFSTLLSDLEEKKKNIYLQRDSQDIMFVRFVYSGSEEVVPVIIKSKDRNQKQGVVGQKKDELRRGNDAIKQVGAAAERAREGLVTETYEKKIVTGQKRRMTWEINKKKLGRPCHYVPISVVLILLMLGIFGRSFAILCTAIGWYLVPTLTGMTSKTTTSSSSSSCGSMKKKKTTGAVTRATSQMGK